MSWTRSNLDTQGYCLSADDARAPRIGLRFPTALCLALVVAGLALESALMIALLTAGAVTAALVLGAVLVAVCSLVTVTNFCIPSTILAWLDGRHRHERFA